MPRYLRRAKSIEELLPWLYLKGISTGDSCEALAALLGPEAPALSASTIARLKEVWQGELEHWQRRDLSAKRYVCFWADGVYFSPRLDHDKQCMCVIIGADELGRKELLAIADGYRESAQSWREVLLDLKRRGLAIALELATGDGALGFWKALREVYGTTREQRCWVHKTANVLNKLPKSVQPRAKQHLQDLWMAETRAVAEKAFDFFLEAYQPVDEVFPGRSRHGLILWCPGLKGGSLMAMGQQKDRQGDLMVSWSEMPRSPGHVFYDRLQLVLIEGGFDGFAEAVCQPYYAARMGAPSVPPGRYFRMHLVGYFEGIDSERGLEWRCSDSLSLREFLLLEMRERVPDHSWLSRTRARLPHEVHTAVFDWVLALIAEAGLVKGERIGVDASTMEANAALRNIVRRDTGEGYRGMLERLAQESGIETPTAEDLARLDRKRKGKKLSNQDWVSRSDPEAKIAKMKDGTTHLAYKPEHAVDLDTGAVVAAELHPADEGDTTTLPKTLAAAEANLEAVDVAPTAEDPAECVTDKGYHSRLVLKALDDGPWKSRISEPKQKGFARWHGDDAARRAVTNNRTRLLSGVAREAFKLRAEIVERSFAHNLDRGGMRRTWLRGRENVHKRYLLHVAGHNLSLLMRQLIGAGTPKEAVAGGIGALFVLVTPAGAVLVVQIVLIVSEDGETAFAAICFAVA